MNYQQETAEGYFLLARPVFGAALAMRHIQ